MCHYLHGCCYFDVTGVMHLRKVIIRSHQKTNYAGEPCDNLTLTLLSMQSTLACVFGQVVTASDHGLEQREGVAGLIPLGTSIIILSPLTPFVNFPYL